MAIAEEVQLPSPEELVPLVEQAAKHWRRSHTSAVLLWLDLDSLYLRSAHLAYGYKNFAVFVQRHVGVPVGTVSNMRQWGAVLRILSDHGHADLMRPGDCPSSGVLRELARVRTKRGTDDMIACWEHCLASYDQVTPGTIKQAAKDLWHPLDPGPGKSREEIGALYPDWEEEEGDEEDDADLINALDLLAEELEQFGRLARRDPERARSRLREIREELASIEEMLG